jgi:sugar lactone lactonase YvrE
MKSRHKAANDRQSLARYFANPAALLLACASFACAQTGSLYVSVVSDRTIRRITSDGSVSTFATGFVHPSGLAFGRDGNLYVADWSADAIRRVSPSGQVTTFVQISKPYGLATDEAGNFYASHISASAPFNNAVSRITTNGSITVFATGFNSPVGIVFDAAGNMYVANRGGNSVTRVPASGSATAFATNLSLPTGLALDGLGKLFVANWGDNTIHRIDPDGRPSILAGIGLNHPSGLTLDHAGNLIIANYDGSNIVRMNAQALTDVFVSGLPTPHFVTSEAVGNFPAITVQPQSQTVLAGSTVRFVVGASGLLPLWFQWQLNGTNLPGATGNSLTISNAQPVNAGNYTVLVTNVHGSVTSAAATLAVRYSLTVLTEGTGQVERNPVQANYPPNSTVTLNAVTTPAFTLTHWSGDATGTNNPLAITMTGHKVITAHFASTTIAVAVEGNGSVSRTPDQPYYRPGDVVLLTSVPARYHTFERWKDGIVTNPRSVVVGATNIYTALFFPTTALETLSFNSIRRIAPVGMPAIFVNDRFITNSSVTNLSEAQISMLTTFPNGSIFFTLDGSEPSFASALYSGPSPLRRSVLIRAVAYDANFTTSWEADPVRLEIEPIYTLDASTPGGGAISVAPASLFYRSNDLVELTAVPLDGWQFLQWLGDVGGTNPATTLRISRDSCVQAMFGTTLNLSLVGNGVVGIDPFAAVYPFGTVVRLTALPGSGNYFAAWGNAASSTNNPLLFQITNANPTVSCAFGPLPAGQSALSVTIDGRGRVLPTPRPNRFNVAQTVTLIAVPDPDQSFLGWSGDAVGSHTNIIVSMNQSKAVIANFTARPELTLGPCLGGWSPDGFQFTLTGDIGALYSIETSANTWNWTPLVTITNHFGISQILNPFPNFQQRFYRVILP